MSKQLLSNAILQGIDYQNYVRIGHELLEQGKSSPADQQATSPEMLEYLKLNLHRMERIGKSLSIGAELQQTVAQLPKPIYLLVISEVWCGDAAQNLPLIAKIAELAPEKIQLKIVWRDLNPELMDAYLTNGSRSIPKVVVLDQELNEIGTWGARPSAAAPVVAEWKASGQPHSVLVETIQLWYAKDKGLSLQADFNKILTSLI